MIQRSQQQDLLTWHILISRDQLTSQTLRRRLSIVSTWLISLLLMLTASSWQISWLWRVSCGAVSLFSRGSLSRIRWFVWNSSDTCSHNLVHKRFKNAAWAHLAQSCPRGSVEPHQWVSAESEDNHEDSSVVSNRISSAGDQLTQKIIIGQYQLTFEESSFFKAVSADSDDSH